MEDLLFWIFFFICYFLWGVTCYCYFKLYKKYTKESWILYIFVYGLRFRIVFSTLFGVISMHLCAYGYIQIVSGQ
jgi:hypothetical protein